MSLAFKLLSQNIQYNQQKPRLVVMPTLSHKVAIGTINLVRMQSLPKSKTPLTSYLAPLTHDMIPIFQGQKMLVFS